MQKAGVMEEGRREGGKEGRREGGKEGRREGGKERKEVSGKRAGESERAASKKEKARTHTADQSCAKQSLSLSHAHTHTAGCKPPLMNPRTQTPTRTPRSPETPTPRSRYPPTPTPCAPALCRESVRQSRKEDINIVQRPLYHRSVLLLTVWPHLRTNHSQGKALSELCTKILRQKHYENYLPRYHGKTRSELFYQDTVRVLCRS